MVGEFIKMQKIDLNIFDSFEKWNENKNRTIFKKDKQTGANSSVDLWNKLKKMHYINDMWKISREAMV